MRPTTSGVTAKTRLHRTRETVFERICSLAGETVRKIERRSLKKPIGSRILEVSELDTLRVLSEIETNDATGRLARSMLLRSAYLCEKKSAYGAFALCKRLAGDFEIVGSRFLTPEVLRASASRHLGYSSTIAILESIECAGPHSTMIVRENNGKSHIRVVDSLEIPVVPISEFGDNLTLRNGKFLCYDGVIETVSEINVVLEKCIASGSPLVIYARGYGYEVVSTLLHNWRAGKLRVLPVTANHDDIQNFYFVDLPKIVEKEEIHASLGERFESLRDISKISLNGKVITVEDSQCSTLSHEIARKISSESISRDAAVYVQERARRLSSRKIEFWVGSEHGTSAGVFRDRVDQTIRFVMMSRRHGIFDLRSCDNVIHIPAICAEIVEETFRSMMLESNTSTAVVIDD